VDWREKEHFPAKLDHADSIWAIRKKYNMRTGIDLFAVGVALLASVGSFFWFNEEPGYLLTIIACALGGAGLFGAGALRLIRWRTKAKQMSKLSAAGDYEGALKLVVEQ